jgi:hypothetical protein
MICGSRMILTSGLFITFLGGLSQVMPGSLEVLGLEWQQIVEAYHVQMEGPRKFQELQEQDNLVLQSIAKKDDLVLKLLQGKATLLETARHFREVDQTVSLLNKLHGSMTDDLYCQQVINWVKAVLKRDTNHWEKGILQQLEQQLATHCFPVSDEIVGCAPVMCH